MEIRLPDHIENPDPIIYHSDNFITLDLECTNHGKGTATDTNNSILLSCWRELSERSDCRKDVLDWGDEYSLGRLVDRVERASFLVAHNAKFEVQWLKRCGATLENIVVWDTMIAEYVICSNKGGALDLNSVAERYGLGTKDNLVNKLIKSGVCPSTIPRKWLLKYCKQDVHLTEKIFKAQLLWILENNPELLNVVFTRCLFTPVLADIEFNGVFLDKELVYEEYEKHYREFLTLNKKLEEFANGINWNSSTQVATFLYEELKFDEARDYRGEKIRTESGARSAAATTIDKLRARTKRQREFIKIYKQRNKISSALSKNLEFFKGVVDELGGVFYAQFNQCITKTQRLSSSGRPKLFEQFTKKKSVQFQNMPRIFKRLCAARNVGWKIAELDGAQLEFRIAAFLGQDSKAIEDIRNGFDVHSFTASIIQCSRQDAKADTFKPLFGGKSGTEAQKKYYKAFAEKYSDITDTQKGWIDEVLATKQLKTITGLVFYWPDTKMSRTGYVTNTTSISNYPIQSFATADIIPIAITYQWHRMKAVKLKSFLINTVHDSSIGEVHPKEEEIYESIGIEAYTKDIKRYLRKIYNIHFNVPLGVGVKIGPHWGQAEEKKYEYDC